MSALAVARCREAPAMTRAVRRAPAVALAVLLASLVAGAAPAFAESSWWRVASEAVPTYLPPGGEGEIIVAVSNQGDVAVNSAKTPITITDKLPPGLTATALVGSGKGLFEEVKCPAGVPSPPLSCTFAGTVNPYEQLTVTIKVKVQEPPGTVTSLRGEVTVQGGGAPAAASPQPLTVSGQETPFGVQNFELSPFNEEGTPATHAGAHPFQLTTTLVMNESPLRHPSALPKDLRFNLPPGLVGNPNAVAQCSETDFAAPVDETNLCPPSSVVGVATVTAFEPLAGIINVTVPVFNLVPAQGEPARFGFDVIGKIPIVIDTAVRTGTDYGVVASVNQATQTGGLLSSQLTVWGVPGDSRHDNSRGWECVAGGFYDDQIGKTCPTGSGGAQPEPFLTLPTSCAANPLTEPVTSSAEADSWAQPESPVSDQYSWSGPLGQPLGFVGCDQLAFTPEIAVTPEAHSASTPTGLSVDVKVPQRTTLEANGLAEADVRDTTVTLPEGVQLSPSAANGLQACSEAQIGFTGLNTATQTDEFTDAKASCPEESKIGTVRIKTPLLAKELEGSVYLASPAPDGEAGQNPFNSLVSLYLVAEDREAGVLVKLAGHGEVSESTGQIRTTFANTPQLPFEELQLELFGGPRGSLATPARCGDYATEAAFTPWSGTGTADLTSSGEQFAIASGNEGSGCPSGPLPFNPGFATQNTSTQAGGFTDFDLEISRPDGDQALSAVTMHLPEGVAALLSSVELCGEAQADADACPSGSEIGEATAVAGLGKEPYVQRGGKVYITGPYEGAPFGLDIVTPADAGPFDLGYVTVRSKLEINPENASVTIVSDPLPTQLRGIPLQLKRVLVGVSRSGFEFNPTDCAPLNVEGKVSGAEGASASTSSGYPVTGCQSLPFHPTLTAATDGHASKAAGTSFVVKVTSKGLGQANIAKVDLQLPKQLPSRLPTIQKACLARVFEANPAACDEGSLIGTATIHTPVLKNPLTGPAYLVSHGNAAFPDVEFVLQGEGIKLVLDGKTQIRKGITYSKFESAPDAPFTTFETVLPAGPHSALTANVAESKRFDLCGETLRMPTTITAQNGDVIEQHTKIAVQGCAAVKAAKAKKLTRAQKLAKALDSCRKRYKHARDKRARCEKQARRRYPLGNAAHKGKHGMGKHAKKSGGQR